MGIRNVRNFWIEADIDGRATLLEGGLRSKNGGMRVKLYQRDNGNVTTAVKITCWEEKGQLHTVVDVDGKNVGVYITER